MILRPTVLAVLAVLLLPTGDASAQFCGPGWLPEQFGEFPGVDDEVFDLSVRNGRLYVAGGEAGGTGARSVVAWDGSRWVGLGGLSINTHAIEWFDDGSGTALYAAPWFAGPALVGLRKWDGNSWTFAAPGLVGFVDDMVAYDDGGGPALYAGGDLTLSGGVSTGLARWDGSSWEALGELNPGVHALHVSDIDGSPKLYVTGEFTMAGGMNAGGFAVWDGTSWTSPGTLEFGDGFALATFDDGSGPRLAVGGDFPTVSGLPVAGLAAWDGSTWSAIGGGTDGRVTALTTFDDGSGAVLVAGGDFSTAGGVAATRVATWDGTSWAAVGAGVGGDCFALAQFDAGGTPGLYAGGDFSTAGGDPAYHIAHWDGAAWSSLGDGFDDDVLSAAWFDDGSGPALYLGGEFSTVAGLETPHIVRYDGTSFSAVGTGGPVTEVGCLTVFDNGDGNGPMLYAGSNDVRRWNGTVWETLPGIAGRIHAFAVFDGPGVGGPLLHAAGRFGGTAYNNVARLFGTNWITLGQGLSGGSGPIGGGGPTVFDLAVYDDGSGEALYAGGVFAGSGSISARNVARWDGITWSPLAGGSSGTNDDDDVYALEVFDPGTGPKLYAKGRFQSAQGSTIYPVGAWNGTSWTDPGFTVPVFRLTEMAVFDDGDGPALYTNGRPTDTFSSVGTRFTRFDGTTHTLLEDGIQGVVEVMAPVDFGQGPELFVGGSFQSLPPLRDSFLARWSSCSGLWEDLGGGTSGDKGVPGLDGTGLPAAGETVTVELERAPSYAFLLAWVSFAPTPFPAVGGTVHAWPFSGQFAFLADSQGDWSVTVPWPAGLLPGTETWFQFVVQDDSVIYGITLSNGLKGTSM